MGYYYDWINEQWVERKSHGRKPNFGHLAQRRKRREDLLRQLLTEMAEGASSESTLYATMLARALVTTDEWLMKEYGKHVAHVTAGEKAA